MLKNLSIEETRNCPAEKGERKLKRDLPTMTGLRSKRSEDCQCGQVMPQKHSLIS